MLFLAEPRHTNIFIITMSVPWNYSQSELVNKLKTIWDPWPCPNMSFYRCRNWGWKSVPEVSIYLITVKAWIIFFCLSFKKSLIYSIYIEDLISARLGTRYWVNIYEKSIIKNLNGFLKNTSMGYLQAFLTEQWKYLNTK